MKKYLMKYFKMSCKEATYLMGLKEEGKISMLNRMKLNMHTSMCSFCKRFEEQSKLIKEASPETKSNQPLPVEIEEQLEALIRNRQ
jgi:hypothetical protein